MTKSYGGFSDLIDYLKIFIFETLYLAQSFTNYVPSDCFIKKDGFCALESLTEITKNGLISFFKIVKNLKYISIKPQTPYDHQNTH